VTLTLTLTPTLTLTLTLTLIICGQSVRTVRADSQPAERGSGAQAGSGYQAVGQQAVRQLQRLSRLRLRVRVRVRVRLTAAEPAP
jgi:hypothetical protein